MTYRSATMNQQSKGKQMRQQRKYKVSVMHAMTRQNNAFTLRHNKNSGVRITKRLPSVAGLFVSTGETTGLTRFLALWWKVLVQGAASIEC